MLNLLLAFLINTGILEGTENMEKGVDVGSVTIQNNNGSEPPPPPPPPVDPK